MKKENNVKNVIYETAKSAYHKINVLNAQLSANVLHAQMVQHANPANLAFILIAISATLA